MKSKNTFILFSLIIYLLSQGQNTCCSQDKKQLNYPGGTQSSVTTEDEDLLSHRGLQINEPPLKIPVPKNLPLYFDSLMKIGYDLPVHADLDNSQRKKVERSFTLLQEYANGKRSYPGWIVKESLNTMAVELGYAYSHSEEEELEHVFRFFDSYLDQACRLCPDINLLTENSSENKEIGILSFEGWGIPVLTCYLIYKSKNGFYRKTRWSTDIGYEKLYPVHKNGKQYYLLVNLNTYWGAAFSLVTITDNGPEECLKYDPEEISDFFKQEKTESGEEKLIFNPDQLNWKFCRINKNGYWIQIPGTQTLQIKFGKTIRMSLE